MMLMQTPLLAQGRVVSETNFFSQIFQTNRFVRVYLPASYETEPTKKFPVLYVHDGQNAFTTAGPHAAFGWGNWELDKTASELAKSGKMREIIMVAVDCTRERYREYRGPSTNWPPAENEAFSKYALFLTQELKPSIDKQYRTLKGAMDTGTLGSSMGGICSLALSWRHPETFGLAASISGAYQVEKRFFLNEVLATYKGPRKPLRVYLDSGITDHAGGDDGASLTRAVAAQLERIGYRPGKDLMHFVDDKPLTAAQLEPMHLPTDKFLEAQKSQHNEMYWRLRAHRALTFLFPPELSGK